MSIKKTDAAQIAAFDRRTSETSLTLAYCLLFSLRFPQLAVDNGDKDELSTNMFRLFKNPRKVLIQVSSRAVSMATAS